MRLDFLYLALLAFTSGFKKYIEDVKWQYLVFSGNDYDSNLQNIRISDQRRRASRGHLGFSCICECVCGLDELPRGKSRIAVRPVSRRVISWGLGRTSREGNEADRDPPGWCSSTLRKHSMCGSGFLWV